MPRTYLVAELIAEFEHSRQLESLNAQGCKALDYLKANRTTPIEEVSRALRNDFGPVLVADIIRFTKHGHNDPENTRHFQIKYAEALVSNFPWGEARPAIEHLIREGGLHPDTTALLVSHLAQHHPNPRSFLTQDEVAAKLPPSQPIPS